MRALGCAEGSAPGPIAAHNHATKLRFSIFDKWNSRGIMQANAQEAANTKSHKTQMLVKFRAGQSQCKEPR